MKKNQLLFLFTLLFIFAKAQTYHWSTTNSHDLGFRFEDVYFLNPDTGYAVHYPDTGANGYITKTMDGGNTWKTLWDSSSVAFRDIGFTDARHGWVGTFEHSNIRNDKYVLYQTSDGGTNWSGVTNLPGPDSAGICGLRVINNTTIYGVGRYAGHAGFYKTTDNGLHWKYTNLDSLALGLVDMFFFNADTGYAVGSSGPFWETGNARILYTTDGGNSWRKVYTSHIPFAIGWKVIFPSRKVGYCSVQQFNGASHYFIKTIDGGQTWQDVVYVGGPQNSYNVEGMGFLNDTVGWVGGDRNTFFTQNGGISWQTQTWGNNLNRFRFLGDTLDYAAGKEIYKLNVKTTGIPEVLNNTELNAYPNPSKDYAYFEFFVDKPMEVKLTIFDLAGNEVDVVFNKHFNYGNQHFTWEPKNLAPGIYVSKLTFNDHILTRKLEILK